MSLKVFHLFFLILFSATIGSAQTDRESRNICLDETADDYQKSVQHFEFRLAQDSSDLDAYHGLGMSLYSLKEFNKAIPIFTLQIERDECYLAPLNNRGISRFLIGDKEGACEDLAQSLNCKMKSKEKKSIKKQFAELCRN